MTRSVRFFSVGHRLRPVSLLAASALLCLALPLYAADFVVTTNQDINNGTCTSSACSLRDAILAANATAEPSTIHLGTASYFVVIQGPGEDEGLVGDFDIKGDLTIIGEGIEKTRIGTMEFGEQIIDVAAGGRLRLEHLSTGIGLRSGYFGSGDVATTRLELLDVRAGVTNAPGNTIVANGKLLIDHSEVTAAAFSPRQAAIVFSGNELAISSSKMSWGEDGLRADLVPTGSARIGNSFLSRYNSNGSELCGSLRINGGHHVSIVSSQVDSRTSQGLSGACITSPDVAIINSAFTAGPFYNKALSIWATTATVRNSTIAGSLTFGSGTLSLEQVTVGSNITYAGVGPASIERLGNSVITVSNSALIGECIGTVVALGNNVESPGNTCGLPAASSRVDQTYASLELGELGSNTPPGAALAPFNYLPGAMSVLNRVFTRDGTARCQVTDQRGFIRAPACTIGAVETGATEQVLFRNGFDN